MLKREKKQGRKNVQGKKGAIEFWGSLREEQCKDLAVGACVVTINDSTSGVEWP